MKTIMLTLSTNDVAIIQRSLLYTAMDLQNESHNQQNSPEVRDSLVQKSGEIRGVLNDISIQFEEQKEQQEA